MATDQASTPATGTGDTVEGAAKVFESLLSIEDGEKPSGEAKGKGERAEKPAKSETPLSEEQENEHVEGDDEDLGDLIDDEGDEHDDSESEESDEGEKDAEADKKPETFSVQVNGKDEKVTLDELKAGYSRQADYTRKTQVLAQERNTVQAEAESTRQERAQLATQLQQATELMKKLTPQEPNWQELHDADPAEWARQREIWRTWKDEQARIDGHKAKLAETEVAEGHKKLQALYQTEQAKLIEAIPKWKDAKVAKAASADIVKYAKTLGYTDAELQHVFDHRVLVMANDAVAYRRLLERRATLRPDPVKSTVKSVRPGSANSRQPKAASELVRAKQRLQKTGNVRDAATAFERLLPDE